VPSRWYTLSWWSVRLVSFCAAINANVITIHDAGPLSSKKELPNSYYLTLTI
jgi:hypothetical protein